MSDTPIAPDAPPATPSDKPLEVEPKLYPEDYVKSLRDEAAAARVAKKDAVEAAVNAVKAAHEAELAARDLATTELQNELSKAQLELEKLNVTIDAKVPSDKVRAFAAALTGTDAESIQSSAKQVYDLAGGFKTSGPAFDPTHGTGGRKEDISLNGDPILRHVEQALGIRPK